MTAYQDLLTDLFRLSPYVGMATAVVILLVAAISIASILLLMTVGQRIADKLDPLFRHLVEKRMDMYVSYFPFKSDRARVYCMMLVHPEGHLDIPKAAAFDFRERLGPRLYFWARVLGYEWVWLGRILLAAVTTVLVLGYLNLLRNLGLFRLSTDYFSYISEQLLVWMATRPTRVYELVLFSLLLFLGLVTQFTRKRYLNRFQPFISQIAKIQLRFKVPAWVMELAHSLHLGIFFGFPHLYRSRVAATGARIEPSAIDGIPRGLYFIYGTAAFSFGGGVLLYVLLCMLGFLQP
jgi:hypothetical protein